MLFVLFVVKFPGYFDNPIQRPQRHFFHYAEYQAIVNKSEGIFNLSESFSLPGSLKLPGRDAPDVFFKWRHCVKIPLC